MPHSEEAVKIHTVVHPIWWEFAHLREKWRITWDGGEDFKNEFLVKFSERETDPEFTKRRDMTPVPAFARAALLDIKNSIAERMIDVTREGGPISYQQAARGENRGVDLRGSSMNTFMSMDVLPELIHQGKVGVFVDMQNIQNMGDTIADNSDVHPYLYFYRAEDIMNWAYDEQDPSKLRAVLLRDTVFTYDDVYGLPNAFAIQYRFVWRQVIEDPTTGQTRRVVFVQFFDDDNNKILEDPVMLDIDEIPFVMLELNHSLMSDIASHQVALLNMESSDVSYTLYSNFPFYTEQQDMRLTGGHLSPGARPGANPDNDGTATEAGTSKDREIQVGVTKGRLYGKELDRPGFIHPSSEPLKASMEKAQRLKDDIRQLVQLALSNVRPRFASAQSKEFDQRGLEAGLASIGQVMEQGERLVADLWSKWETNAQIAAILYPRRYSLKSEQERVEAAKEWREQLDTAPSRTYQLEIAKKIARELLEPDIPGERMDRIVKEIDNADYTTGDAKTIQDDVKTGIVCLETAARARGYKNAKEEVEKAEADHARRVERTLRAQTPPDRPGARGIDDLSNNPHEGEEEKEESQNADLNDVPASKTRGEA